VGIMDKVKQQASTLAERTQEAAKAGQEKLGELQEKRKLDQLYRDLGAAYFAQRQGDSSPQNSAEIDRLVSEIAAQKQKVSS